MTIIRRSFLGGLVAGGALLLAGCNKPAELPGAKFKGVDITGAEYAQALRQHMSELEAQITEATGAEIIFEPIWQRAPHVLRARIKLD